jgi:diguanylate cyclase (GGDEF)-like protein
VRKKENFLRKRVFCYQCVSVHQFVLIVPELVGVKSGNRYSSVLTQEQFKPYQRDQPPLALVLALADVDYFKAYNDSYGHPVGGRCLHALAELLDRW